MRSLRHLTRRQVITSRLIHGQTFVAAGCVGLTSSHVLKGGLPSSHVATVSSKDGYPKRAVSFASQLNPMSGIQLRNKQDLLSVPKGSLTDEHWELAKYLLRKIVSLDEIPQEAVEDAFLILDRLYTEMNPTMPPLAPNVCETIFAAWQPCARKLMKSRGSTKASAALDTFDPSKMAEKLQGYFDAGLIELDVGPCNTVLDVWKKSGDPEKIQNYLRWMEAKQNEKLRPNDQSYAHLLSAWRAAKDPAQCDTLLRGLLDQEKEGGELVKSRHFNIAIAAWGESGDRNAAKKASDLLDLMVSHRIDPDVISYASLIFVTAKSPSSDPAERVLQLFHELKVQGLEPTHQIYNAVLLGLSKSKSRDAFESAENIFQEAKQKGIIVDNVLYNTMATLCGNHGRPDRVEELFQELKAEGEKDESMKPEFGLHQARLQSWSKSGNPEMATTALKEMLLLKDPVWKPKRRDFHSVLQAWVKSNHPEAARKAEWGLRLMMKLGSHVAFDCIPNDFSYNIVIRAYTLAKQPDSIKRAEDLLREMKESGINPSVNTYNCIISGYAWSKVPHIVNKLEKRVEELMVEMVNEGIQPDSTTYTGLMNAYAKTRNAQQVESLFQEMKRGFEQGDKTLEPSYIAHITRLQTWAKEGQPEMATRALKEIIVQSENGYLKKKPSTQEFTACLEAWARSSNVEAADKAEKGLRQMDRLCAEKRFDCPSNVFSYNAVMAAYARSSSALTTESIQKTLQLFDELKERYKNDPTNKLLRPLFVTYSYVFQTVLRFRDPDAEEIIQQLVDELFLQEREFWLSGSNDEKSIKKIKWELGKSDLSNKESLMEQFDELRQQVQAMR